MMKKKTKEKDNNKLKKTEKTRMTEKKQKKG